MKALQVINEFPSEHSMTSGWCVHSLSKELIRKGHDIVVFTSSRSDKGPHYQVSRDYFEEIPVVRIATPSLTESERLRTFIDINTDLAFRTCIAEFNPDIVHIHHLHGLSASMIETIHELGIPAVLSIYDYWYICPRTRLIDRNMDICSGPLDGFRCVWCTADGIEVQDRNWSTEDAASLPDRSLSFKRMLPFALKHRIKTALVPEINYLYRLRAEIDALRREIEASSHSMPHFVERYRYMVAALSKMQRIMAPSFFAREKCIALGFPEDLVVTVPPSFHTSNSTRSTERKSDTLRFAYVGELAVHAGIEVVLKAFASISHSGATLQIFGTASDPAYRNYLHRLAGSGAVTFFEGPAIGRISEILSEVDIVLVPSLWEEVFNPILTESLLADTPVIASRIGALEEAVEDGIDGFLVEPGDADALRQRMEALIHNRDVLEQLIQGTKSGRDIHEQASEDIYEEIIATHNNPMARSKTSS